MARIVVKAKIDGGIHVKYGEIAKGREYEIDEEDFGAELFERPSPEWLSPHEKADKTRAQELEQNVGNQQYEAPPEAPGSDASFMAGRRTKTAAVAVEAAAETKEG